MTSTSGAIPPILLVGCGRMGSAMLSAGASKGWPRRLPSIQHQVPSRLADRT